MERRLACLVLVVALVVTGAAAADKVTDDDKNSAQIRKQMPPAMGFVFIVAQIVAVSLYVSVENVRKVWFAVRHYAIAIIAFIMSVLNIFLYFTHLWPVAYLFMFTNTLGFLGATRRRGDILRAFLVMCVFNIFFILNTSRILGSTASQGDMVMGLSYQNCQNYFQCTENSWSGCDSYCLLGWLQFVRFTIYIQLFLYFLSMVFAWLSIDDRKGTGKLYQPLLQDGDGEDDGLMGDN